MLTLICCDYHHYLPINYNRDLQDDVEPPAFISEYVGLVPGVGEGGPPPAGDHDGLATLDTLEHQQSLHPCRLAQYLLTIKLYNFNRQLLKIFQAYR